MCTIHIMTQTAAPHSEADVRHAEQGLEAVRAYAHHYELNDVEIEFCLKRVFTGRLFLSRYLKGGL